MNRLGGSRRTSYLVLWPHSLWIRRLPGALECPGLPGGRDHTEGAPTAAPRGEEDLRGIGALRDRPRDPVNLFTVGSKLSHITLGSQVWVFLAMYTDVPEIKRTHTVHGMDTMMQNVPKRHSEYTACIFCSDLFVTIL